MFLAAIGVPHQRPDGSYSDGKIGIWAFTEQVTAQLRSKNRRTWETKGVNVDAQIYLDMMNIKRGGVLDAIQRELHHLKVGPI